MTSQPMVVLMDLRERQLELEEEQLVLARQLDALAERRAQIAQKLQEVDDALAAVNADLRTGRSETPSPGWSSTCPNDAGDYLVYGRLRYKNGDELPTMYNLATVLLTGASVVYCVAGWRFHPEPGREYYSGNLLWLRLDTPKLPAT